MAGFKGMDPEAVKAYAEKLGAAADNAGNDLVRHLNGWAPGAPEWEGSDRTKMDTEIQAVKSALDKALAEAHRVKDEMKKQADQQIQTSS